MLQVLANVVLQALGDLDLVHVHVDVCYAFVVLVPLHVHLLHRASDGIHGEGKNSARDQQEEYTEESLNRRLGGDVAVADGDHCGYCPVDRVDIAHLPVLVVDPDNGHPVFGGVLIDRDEVEDATEPVGPEEHKDAELEEAGNSDEGGVGLKIFFDFVGDYLQFR